MLIATTTPESTAITWFFVHLLCLPFPLRLRSSSLSRISFCQSSSKNGRTIISGRPTIRCGPIGLLRLPTEYHTLISAGLRLDGGYRRISPSLGTNKSDSLIFFGGACGRLSASLDMILATSGSGRTRIAESLAETVVSGTRLGDVPGVYESQTAQSRKRTCPWVLLDRNKQRLLSIPPWSLDHGPRAGQIRRYPTRLLSEPQSITVGSLMGRH